MSDDARARFQLVETIFRDALAAAPGERAALIDARTDDASIRAEVRELLAEDERAADAPGGTRSGELEAALDAIVARASVDLTVGDGAEDDAAGHPERIAGYRILGEIGRGGMGVVYEAEQDEPRRRVALKLVATGLASPAMAERFRREARALGRLDHPGIASILEAGTFDAGAGPVPFFAMEFIDGRPIVDALADARASLRDRLSVLADVADAVHHAHQRGVVHRDLKPANVLVDAGGRARVVDFGVARMLDPDEDMAAVQTLSGQLVGTPAYMSPEQAAGDAAAVDARTDIHALGALAHEVLSGRRPLDLDGRSFDEQLRRVRESIPRRLGPADGVPRDVALVIARALEKEPARRHASAAALAEDLRAARDGRPVSARPASTAYLLSRAAARHPVGTTLVAGLAATLIGGTVLIAVLLGRSLEADADARTQLARATREADIADGVRTFLVEDLLGSVVPDRAAAEIIRVDQLVDEASVAARERFAERPEVGREVLRTLGSIDLSLGRFSRANDHLVAAAALAVPAPDASDPKAVRRDETFRFVQAGVWSQTGQLDDAIAAFQRILADRSARLGPDHPETLAALYELARCECRMDDPTAGLERFSDLLVRRERVQGPEHPETQTTRTQIGFTLLSFGQYADARPYLEGAGSLASRTLGPDAWATINAWINEGEMLRGLGEYDAAFAAFAAARAGFERRGTPPSSERVVSLDGNVALTHMERGDFKAAEPILERAIANGDASSVEYESLQHNLGALRMLLGRLDEAEAILLEVRGRRAERLGPEDFETLLTLGLLGEVRRRDGRPADAIEPLEACWRGLSALLGEEDPFARRTAERLATCHATLGDAEAAALWAGRAAEPEPEATTAAPGDD